MRSLVAQELDGEDIVLPLGKGIAGAVGATGETINIPDAYRDHRFDPSFDSTLGFRTNDIYCMPIVNRLGEIVGVLELLNRIKPLTEEDEEFLAGVSVHVGHGGAQPGRGAARVSAGRVTQGGEAPGGERRAGFTPGAG